MQIMSIVVKQVWVLMMGRKQVESGVGRSKGETLKYKGHAYDEIRWEPSPSALYLQSGSFGGLGPVGHTAKIPHILAPPSLREQTMNHLSL